MFELDIITINRDQMEKVLTGSIDATLHSQFILFDRFTALNSFFDTLTMKKVNFEREFVSSFLPLIFVPFDWDNPNFKSNKSKYQRERYCLYYYSVDYYCYFIHYDIILFTVISTGGL